MPSPHAATPERVEPILNPLAWAQVRLNGGPKRILMMCGVYAAAFTFLNVFIYRSLAPDVSLTSFAAGSLGFTVSIGCILLVIVGAGFINRAILRDFNTDMITSHRATAMSGYQVIIGYLTGPTMAIFAFTGVNLVASAVLAQLAGYPFYAPAIVFLCIMPFAFMIWTFAVLAGLCYRGKVSVAAISSPLVLVITVPPLAQLLTALPGLGLLLNYRMLSSITATTATGAIVVDTLPIVVGIGFQVILGLIFFAAAARKFQRDDVSAFNMPLAYVLVGAAALLSALGIDRFPDLKLIFSPWQVFSDTNKLIATLVALLLVTLLPVAQSAFESAAWAKRKARDQHFTVKRPRPYWEAAFTATLVALGVMTLVAMDTGRAAFSVRGDMSRVQTAAYFIATFFCTLLAASGLLRFCYTYIKNGMWILFIFIIVAWVFPILGDMLLEVTHERTTNEKSLLFVISPIGFWIQLLTRGVAPFFWGAISQLGLAIAAQVLALKSRY